MSSRFVLAQQVLFKNGKFAGGAQAYFFEPGTTTPKAVYQDADLTTPHTNPVVADADGYLPTIYLDGVYKYRILDSKGNLIDEEGNYSGAADLTDLASPSGAAMVGLEHGTLRDAIYGATPQAHGAVGDGVVDDKIALQSAVSESGYVASSPQSSYSVSSSVVLASHTTLDLKGAEVALPAGDDHVVQVGDFSAAPSGVRLYNVRVTAPSSQPTNDYSAINIYKADGAILGGLEVVDGYSSLTLEYGDATGTERRTVNTVLSDTVLRGAYMGLEAFSNAYSTVSGLVASRHGKTRGLQHGLRVTGYGPNHLGMGFDLRNRGNCYGPIAINNYANGVSQQAGAFSNTLTYTVTDCENGLSTPIVNGLDADMMSASNNHNFAISGCADGADIIHPLASVFRGTIADCSGFGFYSRIPGDKQSRGNIYDLAITKTGGTAAYFGDSHSHIRIAMKDVVNGAIIAGSYNIVDIVADNINYTGGTTNGALTLSGSNNLVRIVAGDVKQAFSEIVVSGSNNTLDVLLTAAGDAGKVAVTGTGNTIRGRCFITSASSAANDYSGVLNWSGRGQSTVTTNSNGEATIPITAGINTMAAHAHYAGTAGDRHVIVTSTSVSGIGVKVVNLAGTPIANSSMTLRYSFECYK